MTERTKWIARMVLGIVCMLSFFLWSYWVTLALCVIGLVLFPSYWEFLIVAVSFELLYGAESPSAPFVLVALPLLAIAVFLFVEVLRMFIRERVFHA